MKRKKRLLLIQPRWANEALDRNKGVIAPLGLAYVAAYTPPTWDVQILDEHVHPTAGLPEADLVGIGSTTPTINRAYAIARHYRGQGTPVVIGGVHASMMAEEALAHADSVVLGDAEPVWERLVADAEAGSLARQYDGGMADLSGLRRPRMDLIRGRYSFHPVSTSRGCPFRCEFCVINRFYRNRYRRLPVDDVLEEMVSVTHPYVFFSDGNLYGHSPKDRENFLALCRGLIQRRRQGGLRVRRWCCYASVNALEDDESLGLAREAGCAALLVGFESIDPDALAEMNKDANLACGPEAYGRLIGKAHAHGLAVVGEIVVGSDHDSPEVLERTAVFIRESGLDVLRLQILQPFPGTGLFDRLAREGRLHLRTFPDDWDRIAEDFVLGVHYDTRATSRRDLQRWTVETGKRFYTNGAIARRLARIAWQTRSLVVPALVLVNSLRSRKTYYNFVLPED